MCLLARPSLEMEVFVKMNKKAERGNVSTLADSKYLKDS